MADPHNKTSAQVEMEVEEQRNRLENRVSEIQERLSPGQLVDELLGYVKGAGGSDFINNLGRTVQANPLPIALTGIGLAWLMARANAPTTPTPSSYSDREWDGRLFDNGQSYDRGDHRGDAYPYASVKGSALRRVGETIDATGRRYSEFTDDAGAKFKALSDEVGNRAGHFTDEAGSLYSGFTDEAGNRVQDFLDEAGDRIEGAKGWAAETWQNASHRFGDIGDRMSSGAGDFSRRAKSAGSQLQSNAGNMSKTVTDLLHDQPLIGGALAFAVGAAIASALPPTEQEDKLLGEPADQLKAQGAKLASDAYEQGKQQVTDAYGNVLDKAATAYGQVKDSVTGGSAAADNN